MYLLTSYSTSTMVYWHTPHRKPRRHALYEISLRRKSLGLRSGLVTFFTTSPHCFTALCVNGNSMFAFSRHTHCANALARRPRPCVVQV